MSTPPPADAQGWYDPSTGQVMPVVPHNPYGPLPQQPVPQGYGYATPGPGYAGYGGYPMPVGTNGKATASLVTSLVGVFLCMPAVLVGIVLGFVARAEIRRTGQDGAGLALAGILVGGVYVLAFLSIIVFVTTV